MNIRDFLKRTYKVDRYGLQYGRPHIYCKDGFKMSVQAGRSLYCTPRTGLESGEYTTVEIGYPNREEELILNYAEAPHIPKKTVYPYVPTELVDQVIEKHGGIDEAATFGRLVSDGRNE